MNLDKVNRIFKALLPYPLLEIISSLVPIQTIFVTYSHLPWASHTLWNFSAVSKYIYPVTFPQGPCPLLANMGTDSILMDA